LGQASGVHLVAPSRKAPRHEPPLCLSSLTDAYSPLPDWPGFMLTLRIARGRSLPLGASAQADGVNFALLCRHGTAALLVLYPLTGNEPLAEIALHSRRNRTGDHWHVLV